MFRAKYSRLKFWIISICLLIPAVISNIFVRALETSENNQNGFFIFLIVNFVVVTLWINTLANRIRDYGSNPWISLWGLFPFGNILLAFFYGIKQYKTKETISSTSDNSYSKSEHNHSKDIDNEFKPKVEENEESYSSLKQTSHQSNNTLNINEDKIYEKTILKIEENKNDFTFCSQCRGKNLLSNKFCTNCGNKIIDSQKIDYDIKNETTEKILNNISEGIKYTKKLVANVGNKIKTKKNIIFTSLKYITPIVIIFFIIAISYEYYEQNEREKRWEENARLELEKQKNIEKEDRRKEEKKINSDKYYWNDGNGRYFKSKDGYSLHIIAKKKFSSLILVSDKVFDAIGGAGREGLFRRNSISYGETFYEEYKLYYDNHQDGSYDITMIKVSGENVIDTTYFK